MIADHSLFLVKKPLQRIQQQAKTLMTKVINPARKKTDTGIRNINLKCSYSADLLLNQRSKHKQNCMKSQEMMLIVTNMKGHRSHLDKSALISQREKKLKQKQSNSAWLDIIKSERVWI